ncbi:hypothetical protein ASD39_01145 [Sphingomonas sp. Root50]|nr:hypothetical protein ASD17_07160 [Sphingomonas sp. Root1294]KQY73027.1 hypothetical protein ASD39_01145 [Sphingomonas sp. Root50]KRB88174.1 hypothetical protein ASE22_22285 [Sphingomonas sp. Root720]
MAVGCSNFECNKVSVQLSIRPERNRGLHGSYIDLVAPPLFERWVLPNSIAKSQPDYIPAALREDYFEACLIKDDSPKAAATLARRCIQGMIRDFAEISKGRLIDEIVALRAAVEAGTAPRGVTAESVEAIDHVRSIGNIGAHMEKDIDLIVPVDPDEAQTLIELIEMLFEEWYVARDARQKRLDRVSAIGADKKQLIADGRSRAALPAPEVKAAS